MASSANTSATGGYLAPIGEPPATDEDLDAQLQALVAGITGLDGRYVRPRWQTTDTANDTTSVTPRIPNDTRTNWVAVGVISTTPDDNPALIHNGSGDGSTTMRRHETIEVLASFYGAKSDGYASLFRDGLYISQNREVMLFQGLGLIDAGIVRRVPEIVNVNNRRRADLSFRLRRCVERTYRILNVLEADGVIRAASGSTDGPVSQDTPFHVEQ